MNIVKIPNNCLNCDIEFFPKRNTKGMYCSQRCKQIASRGERTDLRERFYKSVEKTPTCWLWTAATTNYGHGRINVKGRAERAHRIAYKLEYGDFPRDVVILHICDNPRCVNPKHLQKGTQLENIADMRAKQRHAHGETSFAKLTTEDVFEIRSDNRPQRQIAKIYGIAQQTVSAIKSGKTWQHLL